jgi:DNA-binding MarR family transcriptional regulator
MKLKDIFASKTQVKLLVFFTENPRKEYYQTELCKKLNESLGSIQYEVNRLVRMKFVNKRKSKIRTFYSLNQDFPLLNEVKSIIKKVGSKT